MPTILVCLGNPPYDRQTIEEGDTTTQRKGGWVRFGDQAKGGADPVDQGAPPIFRDFTGPATRAGAGVHLKNLYNDYVYFWRWALWRLFEQQTCGGVVTFITASWLGYRMKKRAGKKSSPLDDIRPERWTARMSDELLELLWVLEATLAMEPELEKALDKVVAGLCFTAAELPTPKPEERKAPGTVSAAGGLLEMMGVEGDDASDDDQTEA